MSTTSLPQVVRFSGLTLQQWQLLRQEFSLPKLWQRMSEGERMFLTQEMVKLIYRHALTPELKRKRKLAASAANSKFIELYGPGGRAEFVRLYNSMTYRRAGKREKARLRDQLRARMRKHVA